jgi:hypothetical protein
LISYVVDPYPAELDEENTIRVRRDELQSLKEYSARVGGLVEDNARLTDELERHKETSVRIDTLEKENRRLSKDLKEALQRQQQAINTPGGFNNVGSSRNTTPAPSDAGSEARVEFDESKPVSKDTYRKLVVKHNKMFEDYAKLKAARATLEQRLRKEKEKTEKWAKYCDGRDKATAKKDDKIKRLEEEIQRLRARPSYAGDQLGILEVERPSPSRPDTEKETKAQPMTRSDTKAGYGQLQLQVAASDPMKASREKNPESSKHVNPNQNGPLDRIIERVDQGELEESDSLELPNLLNVIQASVEDTQFELLEPHHSSSTDENTDPISPNTTRVQDDAIKEEVSENAASSPYTPVFISSRSVKKRKASREIMDPINASKVKIEMLSSSPVGLAALRYINANESIDLDEIGEKVDTPKKQRRLLQLSALLGRTPRGVSSARPSLRRNGSQSQDHSHPADSEPLQNIPVQRTRASRIGSALQPRSSNQQILPRTSHNRAPKRRRIASGKAIGDLIEDGEISEASEKSARRLASDGILDDLLAKPSPPKHVLSPVQLGVSRNSPMPRNATAWKSGLARQVENSGRIEHEGAVSAPGKSTDLQRPSSSRGLNPRSVSPSRPSSATLRGSAELSRPTSKGSSGGSVQPAGPSSKDARNRTSQFSRPSSKQGPKVSTHFSRPSSRNSLDGSGEPAPPSSRGAPRQSIELSKQSSARKRQPRTNEMTADDCEMDPDQEQLRIRPVHKLKLQDFKVNPNYNQGYNYAFHEVVRNKDDRRCLQGCTKPECCGKQFRALAFMSRNACIQLTESQEDADQGLLEEFLGDNAYKLRNMSKAEREEVLLQAKTRELANKYGRHRHAYERQASPPGFWRTDFPTTQEDRQDREKEKAAERDEVEKRYQEAMRPGGAYMFRDE